MEMVPVPRLTVVLPSYNSGAFLRPAVLSILAAERDDLEIIVVDDGSTDDSIRSVDDLGVRVVRQKNAGEAAARNAGVRASRGSCVTFLDGDDLLISSGLAPRLEYLDNNPKCLDVGGLPSALIDERGEILAPVFERMAAGLTFPMSLTLARYRADVFFPVSASLYMYRREAFERAGPYDEALSAAPDADFHFRLLALGEIPILRVATFDRRLHGANLSLAAAKAGAPAFRPDILSAIREVNRRHGMAPAEIAPWETEYLS